MVASSIRLRSAPAAKISSIDRAQAFARLRRQFHQHIPVVLARERIAARRRVPDREIERDARDQLEARHAAAGALIGEIEQRERPSGEGTPMNAVSTARGRGNSFSTAAVMMPSVPSAPTKMWRRS